CLHSSAQRDSSLTEEFSKLSAKQRSKIALQEQEDAAKDPEFIALMKRGEELFKDRNYVEALTVYKQARRKRPYNVHPKVKIQDLEAYIKERDRATAEPEIMKVTEKVPGSVVSSSAMPSASPSIVEAPNVEPMDAAKPGSRAVASSKVVASSDPPQTKRSVPIGAVTSAERSAPSVLIEGERIFKEGGAVVTERILKEGGRIVIYRKVDRTWEGSVHFRDGIAITARAWDDVFGGR
nr:hypothetical protein [Bacteroidota bacterium]